MEMGESGREQTSDAVQVGRRVSFFLLSSALLAETVQVALGLLPSLLNNIIGVPVLRVST